MKTVILTFLSVILLMLAIDSVWLSVMAKRFYARHIGSLMAVRPRLAPAAFFYLIYGLGITFLVIGPAIQRGDSPIQVFLWGAFFGLVAYATYDLTNQATLKEWPTVVTLVDLVWGSLLTGAVSWLAFLLSGFY